MMIYPGSRKRKDGVDSAVKAHDRRRPLPAEPPNRHAAGHSGEARATETGAAAVAAAEGLCPAAGQGKAAESAGMMLRAIFAAMVTGLLITKCIQAWRHRHTPLLSQDPIRRRWGWLALAAHRDASPSERIARS